MTHTHHVEPPTAFVLAQNKDAGKITAALRMAGYRAIDPVELDTMAGLDRGIDDAPSVVARDIKVLMDCDMIVTGPDCELLPWAVAIVSTACTMKMSVEMIERIAPGWKKVLA
jgi:hypothetical protein